MKKREPAVEVFSESETTGITQVGEPAPGGTDSERSLSGWDAEQMKRWVHEHYAKNRGVMDRLRNLRSW